MKIKTSFLLLAALFVLLISCKKSNNTTNDTPAKKLKYLSQVISVQGTTTTIIDYTYDNKKRLNTMKVNGSVTTYFYTENNLTSVESVTESTGYRQVTEFAYAGDILSSVAVRTYRNNVLSTQITYNYLLVGGKVTEIHHDIYVDSYTYDSNGNITKVYYSQFDTALNFTFDSKPSRYTNGFPKYVINADIDFVSPNNVATKSTGDGVQSGVGTYTYNYDAGGYPTGAVYVNPTVTYSNAKYTYLYTEL